MPSILWRTAALSGALLVALIGASSPASAHGGVAEVEDLVVTQDGDRTRIALSLVYQFDGDPVPLAIAEVTATGPHGVELAPVQMAGDHAGGYTAEVATPTPGTWQFKVVTSFPPGVATFEHEVTAARVDEQTEHDIEPNAPATTHDEGGASLVVRLLRTGPVAAMFSIVALFIGVAAVRATRLHRGRATGD
jgi:hypothetical protein